MLLIEADERLSGSRLIKSTKMFIIVWIKLFSRSTSGKSILFYIYLLFFSI